MTRTQFMFYSALFGASAVVTPTATAGMAPWVDGEEDKKEEDKKEEDKKCGDLKIEVDDIKVDEDDKKVKVTGEVMCLDDDKPAKVFVEVEAKALVGCVNPSGKKIPPGQKKHWVDVKITGSDHIDEDEIDGKSTDFKVTADDVKGFDDPCKKKWSPKVLDVKVTDVDVKVVQDGKFDETECEVDGKGDFWCD